jgi:ribosome biogenesis GTPase
VLRIDAKVCHVEIDGQQRALPLRGRLFDEPGTEKRPIAVGDRVRVTLDPSGGAIDEVLPRTSQLSRASAGEGTREQVLAANVSLVLVAAALAEPTFDALLVDRILAGADRQEIPAAVVLTKRDRDRADRAAALIPTYRALGFPTFATSLAPDATTSAELDALRALLHANTTVVCGASGVGKSSLLNALIPGLDLKVGSIGRIRQGKHTTTHTQLIPLPGGGHVLDTPGIRNFGLFGLTADELPHLFREFRFRLGQCGFRNCRHISEPDCAVRAAAAAGEIAASRLASYEVMLDELEG